MLDRASAYTMPGTRVIDLVPTAGGEPYRIFLSIPDALAPDEGWPLLVTTDGNATFPLAVASYATQAPYPTATNTGVGVIAAIGYPSDEPYDGYRRSLDLVPPPGSAYPPFVEGGPPVVTGGADKLLAFIETDLLPAIGEMVRLNPTRRTLFGHSFGGLFALYTLFERPGLFANWVSASPTIHWEDHGILKREALRTELSGAPSFLHLSAGEYEGDELAPFQYRNEDAASRLEEKKLEQTVLLAREMAARLAATPDGLSAEFELYPRETHMSVLPAAVNRAVGIAFAIKR